MKLVGAVAIGAILEALLRFWLQRLANTSPLYPTGTLFVNVAGSFILRPIVGWVSLQSHPRFKGIALASEEASQLFPLSP